MNPTALLKVIAALAPLMGDREVGAAMVAEIQAMFSAMQHVAHALTQINHRLTNIDQKLSILGKLPIDDESAAFMLGMLEQGNYREIVKDAIILGATHHENGNTLDGGEPRSGD